MKTDFIFILVQIWGKTVKGFLNYGGTNEQIDKQKCIFIGFNNSWLYKKNSNLAPNALISVKNLFFTFNIKPIVCYSDNQKTLKYKDDF